MKIYTSLVSMILAVAMLLLAPYIPHHHHDGAICTIVAHCHENDCKDKRHTQHNGDNSTCIEDEEYLISKSYSWQDKLVPHFFPIFTAIANHIVCDKIYPARLHSARYGYATHYHIEDIATGRAMRAPPRFFS